MPRTATDDPASMAQVYEDLTALRDGQRQIEDRLGRVENRLGRVEDDLATIKTDIAIIKKAVVKDGT